MVDWNFFKNKRRIDVPKWLAKLNLLTYADFSNALIALGVKPPDESIYKELIKSEQKTETPAVVVAVKPSKPTKPSTRRTRKAKQESDHGESADE